MKLSEANVKRTWHFDPVLGNMNFRMEVTGLTTDKVCAQISVDHSSPTHYVERELQQLIIGFIRNSLFPKP